MSEPAKQTAAAESTSHKLRRVLWPRRTYAISVGVTFVMGVVAEWIAHMLPGHSSLIGMIKANEDFLRQMETLQADTIATQFYQDLMQHSVVDVGWIQSLHLPALIILVANLSYAVAHSLFVLVRNVDGFVSAIPLVVFLISACFAFVVSKGKDAGDMFFAAVFTAPVFSMALMWTLLHLILLLGWTLHWLLSAAELIVGLSLSVPLVGSAIHAVVKEREEAVTHTIVHGVTKD